MSQTTALQPWQRYWKQHPRWDEYLGIGLVFDLTLDDELAEPRA